MLTFSQRFRPAGVALHLSWLGLLLAALLLLGPAIGAGVAASGRASLMKDINPGPGDSILNASGSVDQGPASAGGLLFFPAADGVHGEELWQSDGTAAGTTLVADIRPGGEPSSPRSLMSVGDIVFFTADDGVHGHELWKSDGTITGTMMVADIFPGSATSFAELLTNVNGTLFFLARDPVGWGVWKSDGTPAGTVLVKRHTAPIAYPRNVNGILFYASNEGPDGFSNGLWRSDGTAAGTILLKTFSTVPQTDPGVPKQQSLLSLTAVDGQLFFVGYTSGRGYELWKSDGSAAGTALVSAAGPRTQVGGIWFLHNVNGTLLILVDQSQQSTALWRSNGTAASTLRVKDFAPGTSAAYITSISTVANVNGTLVFALYPASQPPAARTGEIWRSDGTTAGTVPIKDQLLHTLSSAVVCGKLYFSASPPSAQDEELWQSDGTAAGTTQVQDIAPGAAGASPRYLMAAGRQLFFSASDGSSGRELWALPIPHTAIVGPTPSVPLPHQMFLPFVQVDASC